MDKQQKETFKKLRQVEVSVASNLKNSNSELVQVKYYNEFTINSNQGPITLKNAYITTEKDKDGKISYHFRWFNEENSLIEEKILVQDGKIYTIPELEDLFGNAEMDMEKLFEKNDAEKGRLKGISEKVTPEQAKKISSEKEEKEEADTEKNEENQKIEEDLADQGEKIKIGKHREIKDDKIADRIPEAFEKGKQYEIAQKEPSGESIILEKDKGKYKINEKIQPGRSTVKRVFSIDPNGNQSESEIPDQLMTIQGAPDMELAENENDWGEQELQTIHVTECQSRIGRNVQMENEGPEAQERKEVEDAFKHYGEKELAHEIGHKKEELENTYKVTEIHLEELRELDIEAVMDAEAQKAKISKESFKEYVKKADGKTLQEKINNAHEEIEQEYMGNQRPR